MGTEEDNKQGFKVVDHRRFDPVGNEKDTSAESSQQTGEGESAASLGAASAGVQKMPEISFGSFFMSLATQALMQLGEIPPPAGMDLPVDREAARQTIEILSMLEQKTKGNLDKDESHLVTEVLHNLRMCYVKKV